MSSARIDCLIDSLIVIRGAFDEMALPMATILLAAARRPGSTSTELGRAVGARPTCYYRHLLRLGDGDHRGGGMRFVEILPHADGRANSVYLTPAGENVVKRICGRSSASSLGRGPASRL